MTWQPLPTLSLSLHSYVSTWDMLGVADISRICNIHDECLASRSKNKSFFATSNYMIALNDHHIEGAWIFGSSDFYADRQTDRLTNRTNHFTPCACTGGKYRLYYKHEWDKQFTSRVRSTNRVMVSDCSITNLYHWMSYFMSYCTELCRLLVNGNRE